MKVFILVLIEILEVTLVRSIVIIVQTLIENIFKLISDMTAYIS